MNLFIIEKYIKRINRQDIYNYAMSINLVLTNEEVDTLYYYLKNYYRVFITDKSSRLRLLNEVKSKVSKETAIKLDELYVMYENKI